MENFLKLILDKDICYSLKKFSDCDDGNLELSYGKFLQKIIFKRDVMVEFGGILKFACSSEPFTVKNDMIKRLIVALNSVLLSDTEDKYKVEVFRCIFETFILSCKEGEKLPALQFFVVLAHLLGINKLFDKDDSCNECTVNAVNFNQAFEVDISSPCKVSYSILKELLVCISKHSLVIDSSEKSMYLKWLQKLIKGLANMQPMQSIFLEMFSTCIDIDFKVVEKNLEHVIKGVLNQRVPLEEDFSQSLANFLEYGLKMSVKFQRTAKFIRNFLIGFKNTPSVLAEDMIFPVNFMTQFSKTVALTSTQQSLQLFDVLMLNVAECFTSVSENPSEFQHLSTVSNLMVTFLKEMKLFAPNISASTLQLLIGKLSLLKKELQKFGKYIFGNKDYILKNEHIINLHLLLCLYCAEVQALIDCYKDSVLSPSELENSTSEEKDWLCCLSLKQWNSLVKLILKANLEKCYLVCFQLALHKLRTLKLQRIKFIEKSTLKIILHQFELDHGKFNIFQQIVPEDFIIMISFLTPDQAKTIINKIFENIMNAENTYWKLWLCDSDVQENLIIILNLFSELLKKTGSVLCNNKFFSKFSWFTEEYFDKNYDINKDNLEQLPVKVNGLLKKWKKLKKAFGENFEQEKEIIRVFELFKLLPINYLKADYRQLGLSFAITVAVILCGDESAVCFPFESISSYLSTDTDASTCFDVGLCLNWLCELAFEKKETDDLKVKVIEGLVRSCPNTKFGLSQMKEMIENAETLKQETPLKMLETRVILYQELGKCWQRGKKRQADNDLIGSFRTKLARMISDEAKGLEASEIISENYKLFFRVFSIELLRAIKMNEEDKLSVLMEQKFPHYFDFAVKTLNKAYDEPSALFLSFILSSTPQLKKFLPEDAILKIWNSLRHYEKGNWRLFCSHSDDDEFGVILSDLLEISETFLTSQPDQPSPNYYEIWVSFFEFSSETKRQKCQLLLQNLFRITHDCDLFLKDLSVKKRICLLKFYCFCVSSEKVILTSHMLDTIIYLMIEFLDDSSTVEDFRDLFVVEVDAALAILLKQFLWSKNKVHLNFVLFKRMLDSLTKRCDGSRQINNDDVILLSTCAFAMEKWVKLMVNKKKDFARIVAYFITCIISAIVSATILPAIKFHLNNCINHFLSISDSHTISYLMRVLKPGHQQVFNSIYNQFKKYHKYTGKI